MGWEIGFDTDWDRDIGYGVPAYCDHPDCNAEIDRGIGYVCGAQPHGGDTGCGLFFCGKHQVGPNQTCAHCAAQDDQLFTKKPDHPTWLKWKLKDSSWKQWRKENPEAVKAAKVAVSSIS